MDAPPDLLTPEARRRYVRQILLPEVGAEGQRLLLAARFVAGPSAAHEVAATYLGRAGLTRVEQAEQADRRATRTRLEPAAPPGEAEPADQATRAAFVVEAPDARGPLGGVERVQAISAAVVLEEPGAPDVVDEVDAAMFGALLAVETIKRVLGVGTSADATALLRNIGRG